MVPIFLLYGGREARIRPAVPDRDQAVATCGPQGERSLRPRARSSSAAPRGQGLYPALRLALQSLQEIAYPLWREYDPEDTLRFFALRLHEVGMIKSTPQKLIAQGTDWRFLTELKKELKG